MKTKSDALLQALNKNELKSFDFFISNNLSGKSRDVLNCWKTRYSEIKRRIKTEDRKKFSRKTLSDLSKQLEKFLILKNLEKDEFSRTIFLSRELRKRHVNKYFEKLLYDFKNVKSKIPGKGFQNILNLLKLNFEEYFLHNSLNDEKSLIETAKDRFRISEILISHSKLFEYLNTRFYSRERDFPESGFIKMEHIISYVYENRIYLGKNYPNVWILYSLYQALNNFNDEKIINATFEFIKNNENNISDEFLQFSYESLLRILMGRIYSGSITAFNNFYKILLNIERRGILKRLHHFQPQHFPIYVTVAIYSGNIKLAENLVTNYSDKITPSFRESVINVCAAMIEIAKGNPEKARNMVVNEKPRDTTVYGFSKMTLLRAYYERNDLNYIYPLIDTLKHYLRRRSEASKRAPNINLFLTYLSRLVTVRKNNGKGLEALETNLMTERYFFHKIWIMEKIEHMKNEFGIQV